MVKEADSRPAVAKLMGSNPISRIQFGSSVKRTWWRKGLLPKSNTTGLAQSVERGPFKPNVTGSSPVIGIELLVSLKTSLDC